MKREVIAFIGRQGSGKSFQSQRLVKERGFKKLSFADPLREIAFNVVGMDFEEGMAKYDELKRTEVINGLNFRNILENLGASVRKFDKDFWANALVVNIKNCPEHIVIDDMRYPNEYEIVRAFCNSKGYQFRAYFCDYKSDIYDENNKHESAAMSNYLSRKGYEDQQLIDRKDIFAYSVLINQNINETSKQQVEEKGNINIQQKGKEVLAMLKELGRH